MVSFYARLGDGDEAYKHLHALLAKSTNPNLLDSHPPFQIDGNFGGVAGMAEMLLQSHTGEIHLLPARPSNWPKGRVTGLRARGGYEVDIAWQHGKATEARVRAKRSGECRVRAAQRLTVTMNGRPVAHTITDDGALVFAARARCEYCLRPASEAAETE